MKIEILGIGCPKCKKVYENTKTAVKIMSINAEIVKVEDIVKITEYAVLSTPALVIDGEVKSTGRIPSPDEIKQWISQEKR